jgi:hypothetical protein
MALSFLHKFRSLLQDDPDDTLVRPSNWNEEHDLTMASQALLGRVDAGDGAVQELTPDQVKALLQYAPIDSPNFIGVPTAPTPAAGDCSDRIATTAFVCDAAQAARGIGYGRYNFTAEAPGQMLFSGTDRFGNTLSNLTGELVQVLVHVNGVRLEEDEFTVQSDAVLALVRGVAEGSSIIIETVETQKIGPASTVYAATSAKIDTHVWVFDGVTTTFPIFVKGSPYAPTSAESVLVSLGGVMQDPGVDFTVAGSEITFTSPPPADALRWGLVGIPITAEGLSLYPAPATFKRYTYAAATDLQVEFGGVDKFGSTLSGLETPAANVNVFVNGVRIEDGEFAVMSDATIHLIRGVSAGTSVIIEVFEIASLDGSTITVPEHNHDCGVFG